MRAHPKTSFSALLLLCLCVAVRAQEVPPAHEYAFTENLTDSRGGPAMESAGGAVQGGMYVFAPGQGPAVRGALASAAEYTIELVVRLDEVMSYRALINFDNLGALERSVFVRDGSIHFFPLGRNVQSASLDMKEHEWRRVVFTREAAGTMVRCYVDGTLRLSAHDPKGIYIANGTPDGILYFCRDDGTENSGGKLDAVRIYHRALTAAEVAALGKAPGVGAPGAVPVPARPVRTTPTAPVPLLPPVQPARTDFTDPNHSEANGFGTVRVALATGNVVVTSPQADIGGMTDCGAVYLFNGQTGALISTLTGATAYDMTGSGGVTALAGGNFVVCSPRWDHGAIPDAGAVTWGHGSTGIAGKVSAENSLTGTSAGDRVGFSGITALPGGNYVVCSATWDHGSIQDAGAATWGDGSMGVTGAVSAENSLTGITANDLVGSGGAVALPDGNYEVLSPAWDHGSAVNAGAVTPCDGRAGTLGTVSAGNSRTGP